MSVEARTGNSLLDFVGSTPTVRLRSVRPPGGAELWLKLEHLNPSGSIEDRAAAAIVDAAPEGKPVLLAATPDRAIAVALAARVRGRRCAVALMRSPTHEQQELLTLLGAELRDAAPEVEAAGVMASSLKPELASLLAPAPAAGARLALIVAPAALARALDGAGVPVRAAPPIPEEEAAAMASRLAREEGLLVGPETGAGVVAALRVAGELQPSEAVLAFALDGGERYFSAAMERGT